MSEQKTKSWEESPGSTSMMRVCQLLSLFAGILFGIMEIKAKAPFPYVTCMFVGGGFLGKAGQKFAERK